MHILTQCILICTLAIVAGIGAARAQPVRDFPGSVVVAVDRGQGWERRAALTIGTINRTGIAVLLLPRETVYGHYGGLPRDVRLADETAGGPQYAGQVLDVPVIPVPPPDGRGDPFELSSIGMGRAGDVGIAACLRQIAPGQDVTVVSASLDPTPGDPARRLRGRVERLARGSLILMLDGAARPSVGEPVFVHYPAPGLAAPRASDAPRVVGIVAALLPRGRVLVATLPAIFQALPAEAPTWGLQPVGLCIDRRPTAEPGMAPVLTSYLENSLPPALQASIEATQAQDGAVSALRAAAEARTWLASGWPQLRAALTAPEVEQYFFNPSLPAEQQFAQFLFSLTTAMRGTSQPFRSPLEAMGPVVRLRAVPRDGSAEARGWAVAVRILDRDQTAARLLLLTALHLVAPDAQGGEREIRIYTPDLQGIGLDAIRLPFVDRELDLATLVVGVPATTADDLFRHAGVACPDSILGEVEIPVTVSGWRRASLRGSAASGTTPGGLRVAGVEIVPGLSGSALVRNGAFVAGIVTGNLGPGRGALGATLAAGMRLLPPGPDALRTVPDCPPRSLEDRATQAVRRHLLGRPTILSPTRGDLRALFGVTATRLDPVRLPTFPTLPNTSEAAALREALLAGNLEARCALLHAAPPTSDIPGYRRRAPWGQCDLSPLGLPGVRPRLEPSAPIPICQVTVRPSDGRPLTIHPIAVMGERVWNATLIAQCDGGFGVALYVPAGWVAEQASAPTPSPALVTIAAGPVKVGGCMIRGDAPASSWLCQRHVDAPLVDVRLDAFRITRFPVTVGQYARCVASGRCRYRTPEPDIFKTGWIADNRRSSCNWAQPGRALHPMNCVNWDEAAEFCRTGGGRLPTEAEWERAVRGSDGPREQVLPAGRWILIDAGLSGTMEVGLAPELRSPAGIEDMLWHIAEWTGGTFGDYPALTRRADPGIRTIRGRMASAEQREPSTADYKDGGVAFRCAYPAGNAIPDFLR